MQKLNKKKMENLLQRLKKEYRDKLEIERLKFPLIVDDIKEDLKNNISINEAKYGTFISLKNSVRSNENSFFNYFNNY